MTEGNNFNNQNPGRGGGVMNWEKNLIYFPQFCKGEGGGEKLFLKSFQDCIVVVGRPNKSDLLYCSGWRSSRCVEC